MMVSQNRPYQVEAIAAIKASPHRCSLLCLATGLGKTYVAAQLPEALNARRVLVLAHRQELIEQLAGAFRAAGLEVGVEKADDRARGDERVIVASTATLSMSPHRLDRLLEHGAFDLVIRDEAHHALAATEMQLWARLGFLDEAGEKVESPAGRLIGLTATPGRGDGETLRKLFDGIDYEMGIEAGTRGGWLVPIRAYVITTTTILDVRKSAGDFAQGELARAVNVDSRNAAVIDGWDRHARGRRCLVFGVDVAHAEVLAERFRDAGVEARCVHGRLGAEERAEALAWFQATPGAVLTNCALIDEGTDLPGIEAVIMAAPTTSATRYAQRIGRGVRPAPGKTDVVVIDLVDQSPLARRAFDIRQLFNMPQADKVLAGESILEERDAQVEDALLQASRVEASRVVTESRSVDLFGTDAQKRPPGATLRWVNIGGAFVLELRSRDAKIVLEPDELGGATLSVKGELQLRRRHLVGPDALLRATRMAEETARSELGDDVRLLELNAPWTRGAPTEKQLALCRRRGIRVPHGATRGDVASAISALVGRAHAHR